MKSVRPLVGHLPFGLAPKIFYFVNLIGRDWHYFLAGLLGDAKELLNPAQAKIRA